MVHLTSPHGKQCVMQTLEPSAAEDELGELLSKPV